RDEEGRFSFLPLPSCEGGRDATESRRGGLAAAEPHHPGASHHPSSTRRGDFLFYLCPPVKEGATRLVSRRGGKSNPNQPPRRFAPPLLDEEGSDSFFSSTTAPCEGAHDARLRQPSSASASVRQASTAQRLRAGKRRTVSSTASRSTSRAASGGTSGPVAAFSIMSTKPRAAARASSTDAPFTFSVRIDAEAMEMPQHVH